MWAFWCKFNLGKWGNQIEYFYCFVEIVRIVLVEQWIKKLAMKFPSSGNKWIISSVHLCVGFRVFGCIRKALASKFYANSNLSEKLRIMRSQWQNKKQKRRVLHINLVKAQGQWSWGDATPVSFEVSNYWQKEFATSLVKVPLGQRVIVAKDYLFCFWIFKNWEHCKISSEFQRIENKNKLL